MSSLFRKHGLHLRTAAAERGASGAIVQGSSQPSLTGFLSITLEGYAGKYRLQRRFWQNWRDGTVMIKREWATI